MPLSEKSRAILEAIAKGRSYEQILVQELAWTYHDIFQAAAEALEAAPTTTGSKAYSVEEIRSQHRCAYEKWDAQQEEQLRQLHRAGKTVTEIAQLMQRQPGGIGSTARLRRRRPAPWRSVSAGTRR